MFRAYYAVGNVTTSDSGMYTCNVTNPIGSDTATISVMVVEGIYICNVIFTLLLMDLYVHQGWWNGGL